MDNLFPRCAGWDVHKKSVEACVRRMEPTGRLHQATPHGGTMTRDLLALADGMKGSFIPPRPQRELRDLTRHRTPWVQEKTRTLHRLHKVLEDANIQRGSVATDLRGTSGRALLERLIEGEPDPVQRADLAQRPWRGKIPEWEKALEGHLPEHHRFFLKLLGKQWGQQEALIAELDERIEERTRPLADEIERRDSVPGVDRRGAEVARAEVGADRKPFPTHHQVAAGAGMGPGHEASAGKRRRRRITPGNRWLKQTLGQAAGAASHRKNPYGAAQFRRRVGRRGKKRALAAVGHSRLVIFYHMLKKGTTYAHLGGDFFDRLEPERLTRYYVKRLEALGHKVTLQTCAAA